MIGKSYLYNWLSVWQIHHLAVFIWSMFCFIGCSQRELCYDHSHTSSVKIEFDWSEAPDVVPGTMVVYFFPVDNSKYWRFELVGNGTDMRTVFNSTLKVPPGTYHVVCHNGETENNVEKGTIFSDYQITTYEDNLLSPLGRSDDAPRPEGAENQPVRAQANELYAYSLPDPVVLEQSGDKPTVIVMKPRKRSTVINVTIDNVKNVVPGIEFCGMISGLAESWYPATGMPGGKEVIVPLQLVLDDACCLRGSMEVFGDNAPHNVRHKFRLYTSQKYYYDFDITEQIHAALDPNNVSITLSNILLPDTGEGMGVSVGEWGPAEDIDINM